ncbi:hypothetical protein [Jonesia denitrificans]|uniref:Pyrrolo-quinoline quinone n=1 Tax=Jonesia denitrificans (strain ATCC 14870 / DSM 20603 / BCRC 15368 / CIP 55.134 / JCM 11481 / NBRC 15587 / NCTC 10816 / Prevot 55134) TaxID=471856 RepID=C7QZZ1_JONDD|nr:hypothetical protein [Jonesia denitrificans]ACV09549.1 hypothetical protein Jden_1906 [Jonesia denitrificans DSM 20603]ASE09222.1 hypothetical protein CEP80_08775 [Jonesia denitrificans]QXB43763.1 hypothetical protein I6L70_02425 [Jonesia denitrificans]SQH21956.1 Uncharacterised protein [Jonesia denitrificans]
MPSLSSVRNVVLSAVVMFLAFTVAACSAPASQSSTPPPQPTHENTRGVTAYGTDGAVVEWSVVHRDAVSEIPRDMVVSDGHVVPVWGCDRFIVDRGDAGAGLRLAVALPGDRCGEDPAQVPAGDLPGVVEEGIFRAFSPSVFLVDGAPRRVTGMTVGEGVAVWQEHPVGHADDGDWFVFAADVLTGDTWLLLTSRDVWGELPPIPSPPFRPVVTAGQVSFSLSIPADGDLGAEHAVHVQGDAHAVHALVSIDVRGAEVSIDRHDVAGVVHLSEGLATVSSDIVEVVPTDGDQRSGRLPAAVAVVVEAPTGDRPVLEVGHDRAGYLTVRDVFTQVAGAGDVVAAGVGGDLYVRDSATNQAWKVPSAVFPPMLHDAQVDVTNVDVVGTRVAWSLRGHGDDAHSVVAFFDVDTQRVAWANVAGTTEFLTHHDDSVSWVSRGEAGPALSQAPWM